jgi:putative transposase
MDEATRNQIKETMKATHEKRRAQALRVYELKVNCRHLSKENRTKLNFLFIQAKWISNFLLSQEDIFAFNYAQHKDITHKDKDGNDVTVTMDIPSVYYRGVTDQVKQDIVNLSKKKKAGGKVGRLKFKKEVNCVPMRTGYLKVKSRKAITIPGFKDLHVHGLDQFYDSSYEIADAKIIRKASGFYVKVSVCVDKAALPKRAATGREVGLDFGIKDAIVTSDGDRFNFEARESEQLKFLQRQLKRKQKGSKRYWKLRNQIGREYEKQSNRKVDFANKTVARLLKDYDWVYFQDENLSGWKRYNKGFARKVQSGGMGRVKAKLVLLQGKRTTMLSRWVPTTKTCVNCGLIHDEITLKDRVFRCGCGVEEDRDVHAAKNMITFGSRKRTECLEQASAEEYVNSLALKAVLSTPCVNAPLGSENKEDPGL